MCANNHKGHTKAYFKDTFVEENYSNVSQTSTEALQQNGTIHQSGNIFFRQDQALPKPVFDSKKGEFGANEFARFNKILLNDHKDQIKDFVPNFEIYVGNDNFSRDRVQIKLMKNFNNRKQSLKDSVMKQVKNCQVFLNNCKSSTAIQLLEYVFVHNNLYLVTEAHEISLVEHLPYLVEQNYKNELVSILVLNDLMKILKNIYSKEVIQSESSMPTFNSFLDYKDSGGHLAPLSSSFPIAVLFDPRTFYF